MFPEAQAQPSADPDVKYRSQWRAGFYKWKVSLSAGKQRKNCDADIKEHLLAIHRLRPFYGYIRMTTALKKEGLGVNHKKVRRLMRELGIRPSSERSARMQGANRRFPLATP
ncbi:transposase [Paenibacillus albicereus]|uniref:Transposase n=1 Tax=Paenibacillus albicereus TaxID=2726185 RepID=A0A6H2H0W0_9BACL|nr:transposase [Paenibacillus albicereus]